MQPVGNPNHQAPQQVEVMVPEYVPGVMRVNIDFEGLARRMDEQVHINGPLQFEAERLDREEAEREEAGADAPRQVEVMVPEYVPGVMRVDIDFDALALELNRQVGS